MKATRGDGARRELMKFAIDCFARYGYQATSIDRIAKAAGVTKGALYYHFKDKEELLFGGAATRAPRSERVCAGHLATQTREAGEALGQGARACSEPPPRSTHRRFIVTLMVEALDSIERLSQQFRTMMNRFRQYLIDIIEAGKKSGLFRQGVDATLAAQVYAATLMGAEIQYYQDPENVDLSRILETFLDQFIRSLAA